MTGRVLLWLLLLLLFHEDYGCPLNGISFHNRKNEEQKENVGSWEACIVACIERDLDQSKVSCNSWTWRKKDKICITMTSYGEQSQKYPDNVSGDMELCDMSMISSSQTTSTPLRCNPANYDENTTCCMDSSKCELGEGPCHSDSECSDGLTCAQDNCDASIDASLDCCGHSTSNSVTSTSQHIGTQFASPNKMNDQLLYEPNTDVVKVGHYIIYNYTCITNNLKNILGVPTAISQWTRI